METPSLRARLDSDVKQALKSGAAVKVTVLRSVIAAIANAESAAQDKLIDDILKKAGFPQGLRTTFKRSPLDEPSEEEKRFLATLAEIDNAEIARQARLGEADVLGVFSKQAKQRQDSIAAFKQGNRPDLVAREEAELVILRAYLPAGVTREEIVAAARKIIAETGAQGPRDKGKVMPRLIAEFKGRAEGREINEVVSELLK